MCFADQTRHAVRVFAGLESTYTQVVVDHQDIITEGLDGVNKRELRFWSICAEKMGGPEGVLDLTQYQNDPCSHIMVYMRGQCKEVVAVRSAPSA